MRLRPALLALVPLLSTAPWVGCSSSSSPPATPAAIPDAALGGSCGAKVVSAPPTSANHVPIGTDVTYSTNPPCGGDHYAIWATWGVHTQPLPPEYWVHNEEHGGVVLLYRCADRAACPALAAQLEAVAAQMPADPICDPSVRTRVVVIPDPDLPDGVQVAAAAWGYAWTASCFDGDRMLAFANATEGHGREQECAQGYVSDDAGVGDVAAEAADAASSEVADAIGE